MNDQRPHLPQLFEARPGLVCWSTLCHGLLIRRLASRDRSSLGCGRGDEPEPLPDIPTNASIRKLQAERRARAAATLPLAKPPKSRNNLVQSKQRATQHAASDPSKFSCMACRAVHRKLRASCSQGPPRWDALQRPTPTWCGPRAKVRRGENFALLLWPWRQFPPMHGSLE